MRSVLSLAFAAALAAAPIEGVWLESFDAAWRIIRDTYYDTTYNGHDWEAVRRELRPQAEAADTPEEVRKLIREMLARLGDSHLTLLPGGASAGPTPRDTSGDPGLEIRYLDDAGEFLVVDVVEGSGAEQAGVRRGWLLRAVDGVPVRSLADGDVARIPARLASVERWRRVSERLRGPIGSRAKLRLLDGGDQPREVLVERRGESGEPVKLGMFPTIHVRTSRESLRSSSGGTIGYMGFNAWLTPVDAFVASTVDAHRQSDGMVIDLRGNPGGLAAMLMGIAGQFVPERVSLGEMRTREGTLQFFANPRLVGPEGRPVKPFAGRVAILVDGLSGSASECFTGGMQAIGRARVFGERTMGQALPALFDKLPSGDILVHAYADFVTAGGTRLEGVGVVPDVEAPWSRPALLQGRDAALEEAVAWAGAAAADRKLPVPNGL
jgi:carboxyl-terminal processing protease